MTNKQIREQLNTMARNPSTINHCKVAHLNYLRQQNMKPPKHSEPINWCLYIGLSALTLMWIIILWYNLTNY